MLNVFQDTDLSAVSRQITPEFFVVGDPHLGKVFNLGVPLHRKGEREAHQLAQFIESLNDLPQTVTLHVVMGDLFNASRVSEEIILATASAYRAAALAHPKITYVILAGNHDLSRNVQHKSSFEVLAAILSDVDNIKIPTSPCVIQKVGIVPWHPIKSSHDLASELPDKLEFICGHWDFLTFDAIDNAIPYENLIGKCTNIITGHYHRSGIHQLQQHGQLFNVLVTGSLQPYAHDQDPFDTMYQTHSLKAVSELLSANPDHFKDLCLRIELLDDEDPLADINCLSLTHKRIGSGNTTDIKTEIDSFDLESVYRDCCSKNKVSKALTNTLWKKISFAN